MAIERLKSAALTPLLFSAVLALSGAATVLAYPAPALADVQASYPFNLPEQPLGDTLRAIGQQTATNILFEPETVMNRTAPALRATLTASQAIERVLKGSNLAVKQSADAILIRPTAAAAALEGGDRSRAAEDPASSQLQLAQVASHAVQGSSQDGARAAAERTRDTAAEPQNNVIQEIIVTAQKRTERLQEVPISISVLSGETLDRSSFTSMNDALRTVAGITMYENQQAGMSKIAIRGVTSNVSLFNGASVVGFYMDELPFGFIRYPVTPDVNVYDLERVEVLRGPQGTLYGANSLNGVVRILTKDANLDEAQFKARTTLSSTEGGSESYRADAAVNVPLIPGKLAARAVLGYADSGGWIDQPASRSQDYNHGVQKSLRLKVNGKLADNFDGQLMTWFSRDHRGGSPLSLDNGTSTAFFPEVVENRNNAFSLKLTYDFDSFSLLSATNYTSFFASSVLNVPVGAGVAGLNKVFSSFDAKQTSEEIRLSSRDAGAWRWSAGGIYRQEKDNLWQNTNVSLGIAGSLFESESFALFGELTRKFFDGKWELTGGLRYFEDDTSTKETSVLDPASLPLAPRKKDSSDALTPRVVLAFKPTESSNYYVSYAQGFRSGFSQNPTVIRQTGSLAPGVEPDKLTNYEIGTKQVAWEGRIGYELAAYYIDWKDTVQVINLIAQTPNGPVGYFGATNSKGVSGPGFDAAASVRVTDRLDVTATVSWNDLAFDEDVFSGAALLYPKDSRPPESSETTAGATIDYTLAPLGDYSGRLSAGVTYLSKLLTAAATTAASLAGDNLLTARSSFTLEAPTGWSAMLFVDNLTNEDGRVRPAAPLNAQAGSDRFRPRTYGVQFDYDFR